MNMNKYDIRITGKDVKRFIRNLYSQGIEFFYLEYGTKTVLIRVGEKDFQKIKEIKTIYEVEVVRIYGPVRIKSFFLRYRLFFGCLCLGLGLIYFLSHVIFQVDVVHNKEEIRNLILEELKTQGIEKYHFVKSFSEQEKIVQDMIRKYRDKIEWMEIERVGVSYIVKVEERKIKDYQVDETPRDLVAKKEGRIISVEAKSGNVLVTPGTYVKKGDVLVSGEIKNKDTVMAKVHAEGKVFAEVWYEVTVELPYHYSEEVKTGNKKKTLSLQLFHHDWNLFDFSPYEEKKEKDIFTIKNNILPFFLSWQEEEEIIKKDTVYSKEQALLETSRIANEKLRQKIGEEDKILYEKSLKIMEEDSKIVVVIFFKVKEDITDYQPIKEEPQQELDEES